MLTLSVSYQAKSIDECFALIERGAKVTVTKVNVSNVPENDEEEELRKEYARVKGLKRARITPDMLQVAGIATPLEWLRLWKAGEIESGQGETENDVPPDDNGDVY